MLDRSDPKNHCHPEGVGNACYPEKEDMFLSGHVRLKEANRKDPKCSSSIIVFVSCSEQSRALALSGEARGSTVA
jgi:hypothetical protein